MPLQPPARRARTNLMLCIPICVALVVTISDNVPAFIEQLFEFSALLESFLVQDGDTNEFQNGYSLM